MNYEQISLLIAKQLVGSIDDEERLLLEEWRAESAANEAAYQRLMDKERLTMEHERRKLTDYERPLQEMKHRLVDHGDGSSDLVREATDQKSRPHDQLRWLAAAVAALLIIGGGMMLWNRRMAQPTEQTLAQTEIRPGHTQATLTRANGETVELTEILENTTQGLDGASDKSPSTIHLPLSTNRPLTSDDTSTLSTPRGGEFKVTLEDGTEVWLNAETTLRYPEAFSSQERRVEVTGEAYFRVAHDTERPFYVVSGGQEVRVYGTEFNVNGYADDTDIRTTLVEGSISLRPLNGNGSELMLSPGNQAVFDKRDARARVQQVDTEVVTSWRSGTFVFEDQTMEQIMRTLSRWYDFQYEFTSPALAGTVFMGSIPRYGSFAEVAQIFEKMGGIRLRQKSGKVIISER